AASARHVKSWSCGLSSQVRSKAALPRTNADRGNKSSSTHNASWGCAPYQLTTRSAVRPAPDSSGRHSRTDSAATNSIAGQMTAAAQTAITSLVSVITDSISQSLVQRHVARTQSRWYTVETITGTPPAQVGPRFPHLVVLVGATGDLARRKLLPGLFRL